jgi:hypothetical protein
LIGWRKEAKENEWEAVSGEGVLKNLRGDKKNYRGKVIG